MRTNDTVILTLNKSDAKIIEEAIELYQKEKGINKYQIRWKTNGLRMEFEDIRKKRKAIDDKGNP